MNLCVTCVWTKCQYYLHMHKCYGQGQDLLHYEIKTTKNKQFKKSCHVVEYILILMRNVKCTMAGFCNWSWFDKYTFFKIHS